MAPFLDSDYQTNTLFMSTGTWNQLYYGNVPQAQVYAFPVNLWSDLLGRDRFFLARARGPEAAPYASPTLKVRPEQVRLHLRRPSSGSRWERSPLHKRALARR